MKKSFVNQDEKFRFEDRKITIADSTITYATVNEAIDFINENLAISSVLKVDNNGILLINGPDCIYRVDLRKAEFAFNPRSDDPKVRIYGDWCVDTYSQDEDVEEIARESFTTHTRRGAYEAIKAFYFIKSAFSDFDPAKIASLKNVTGAKTDDFHNIQEAIDYINDRLTISIIMGIDKQGEVTVNASDSIYRFDIRESRYVPGHERYNLLVFINSLFGFDHQRGVKISSRHGLKKYEEGRYYDTMDEEIFSCASEAEIRQVIQALDFIKSRVQTDRD